MSTPKLKSEILLSIDDETAKTKTAWISWLGTNIFPAWPQVRGICSEAKNGKPVRGVRLNCTFELQVFLTHNVTFEVPPEVLLPQFKLVHFWVQPLSEKMLTLSVIAVGLDLLDWGWPKVRPFGVYHQLNKRGNTWWLNHCMPEVPVLQKLTLWSLWQREEPQGKRLGILGFYLTNATEVHLVKSFNWPRHSLRFHFRNRASECEMIFQRNFVAVMKIQVLRFLYLGALKNALGAYFSFWNNK